MAEDVVKVISRPGSPVILVFFDPERRYPILRGTLSAGTQNTGVGKFCDFRLKLPSISETVRDRPMVAMER